MGRAEVTFAFENLEDEIENSHLNQLVIAGLSESRNRLDSPDSIGKVIAVKLSWTIKSHNWRHINVHNFVTIRIAGSGRPAISPLADTSTPNRLRASI